MGWDPSAYILEREYCDLPTIAKQVGEICQACGATFGLLLVWHRTRFFRSLAIYHPETSVSARALTSAFQRITLKLESSDFFRFVAAQPRRPLSDYKAFFADAATLRGLDSNDLTYLFSTLDQISPSIEIVPLRCAQPHTGNVPSVFVLLGDPTVAMKKPQQAILLRTLQCMVSSFPSVSIYRDYSHRHSADASLAQAVDTILAEANPYLPDSSRRMSATAHIGALAKKLLGVAMNFTSSASGRWYTLGRETQALEVAVSVGFGPETVASAVPLGLAHPARQPVIAYATQRRQPFIINDHDNLTDRYPHLKVDRIPLADGKLPDARLIWPIGGMMPRAGPILAVVELQAVNHRYTWEHLELLEQISAAYRDLSYQIFHGVTATFLRDITHGAQFGRQSDSVRQYEVEHGRLCHVDTNDISRLPLDLSPVRALIEHALRGLFELTPSYFVTLRLLSKDTRHLVRFCSYISTKIPLKPLLIPLNDFSSVTAWVCREGQPCVVDDYSVADWARPYVGLEGGYKIHEYGRSSFTVPIFVMGRAIGTLHMESAYPNAYSNRAALAGAVADAIAAGISAASRNAEEDTLAHRAWKSGLIHEVRKLSRKIDQTLRKYEKATPGVFNDLVAWSDQLLGVANAFDQDPSPAEATLEKLVRAVVDELSGSRICSVNLQLDGHLRCDTPRGRRLRLIIQELLHNALKADPEGSPTLRTSRRKLGGQEFLIIHFVNSFHHLAADLPPRLFSQAVKASEHTQASTPHYGTVAIATMIRQMGGDVYVSSVDYLRSVIEIRLEVPIMEGEML